LENITIQILYGLIAVTISFIAIVRQVGIKPLSLSSIVSSHKPLAPKSKRPRTQARTGRIRAGSRSKSRGKTTVQLSRSRNTRRRLQPRPRGDAIVQPVAVTPDTPMTIAIVQVGVPACPTCGLQAPEALMMEHFQASPSHELGAPEPQPTIMDGDIPAESILVSSEEDSRTSMRNLLQMLVPPRAFGRRHQHRTVNPLSQVIQTLEEARSGLIHPLK
jgi:hypothetical protein